MKDQDDQLIDELRAAAHLRDAVPQHLVDGAKAALTFRTFDADLAELIDDAVAGVRAPAAPELLSFVVGERSIELDVGGERVDGQIVPAGPSEVGVHTAAGDQHSTRADARGHFTFDRPDGPVRLTATCGDRRLVTDWFIA